MTAPNPRDAPLTRATPGLAIWNLQGDGGLGEVNCGESADDLW